MDEDAILPIANSRRSLLDSIAEKADAYEPEKQGLEDYMPDDPNNRAPAPEDEAEHAARMAQIEADAERKRLEAAAQEEDIRDDDGAEQVDPVAEPRKFKIKVNGREVELTEQELVERAQKVSAADQYLQEAAEARRQALTPPAPVEPELSDEDLAIARTLQLGSEDEAAKVIAKLRRPSVDADAIVRRAKNELRFESDAAWFQSEYRDVFNDDMTRRLAIQLDQEAVQNGDQRPYRERYADIGNRIRTWRGTTPDLADKQNRKAQVAPQVKPANVRHQAVKPDSEEDMTDADVIRRMARNRGQSLP